MKLGTILKSKLFVGIASTATVAAVAITAAVIINQPEAYRIIKVLELSGSASVERSETGTMEPFEGMNLQSGDTVSVYEDSEMYLNMDEDKYLTVEENTVINLIADGTAENSRTEIELKEGAILNNITQPLSSESSYTVNTPKAVMAVRGTKFRVEVTVDEDGNYITTVTVENGKVEIRLIDEDGNLTDEYIMAIAGDTVVIKTTPNSDKDPALDGTSFFVVYDAESGKYIPLYSVDGEKHEQTEVTTEEVTTTETTTAEETTATEITSAPVTTTITEASYTAPVTVPVQQTTAVQTTISSETEEAVTTEASSETTTKVVATSATTTTTTETTTVGTEASTTTTTTTRTPFYPPVITGPTITSAVTTAPETTTSVTTVSSTAATTTIVTTVPETTTVTTIPAVTTSEITTVPETTTTTVTTTTPETTTTTTTTTEAPAATYSVVFEVDGAVYDEFEYEEGDVITSVPDIPEKEGYTGKWVTSDGNELTVGTIIEGDMTITAEYTINTYTVTFLNEDGTTYTTRTVDYGNSVSVIPPVPEKEGYTGKWMDSKGNELTEITAIKSDITVTAAYTINTYTVTFIDETGTVATKTVDYGGTVAALPDISEVEGHTGKWVDADGNEFTTAVVIKSDMTITAEYTIISYTVTFVDETGTVATRTVDYGGTVAALPDISEVEGHTGKWVDADGNEFTTAVVIKSDMTITAEYTINSYTVTFVDETGTVATRTVDYGGTVATLPDVPEVEGHTGKWVDADGNEFTTAVVIKSDMTITAEYTAEAYTVTFVDRNGTTIAEYTDVAYGEAVEAPSSGYEESYSDETTGELMLFLEWNTDYTNITGNATIEPVYLENTVASEITLILADGTISGSTIYNGSCSVELPELADAENGLLTGWFEVTSGYSHGSLLNNSTFYDSVNTEYIYTLSEPTETANLTAGRQKVYIQKTYEKPVITNAIHYYYYLPDPSNPNPDPTTSEESPTYWQEITYAEDETIPRVDFDTSIFSMEGYTVTFTGWRYFDTDMNEYSADEIEGNTISSMLLALAQFEITETA